MDFEAEAKAITKRLYLALDSIYKGYPNKTDSTPKKIAKARAEMRKLFEEDHHD